MRVAEQHPKPAKQCSAKGFGWQSLPDAGKSLQKAISEGEKHSREILLRAEGVLGSVPETTCSYTRCRFAKEEGGSGHCSF